MNIRQQKSQYKQLPVLAVVLCTICVWGQSMIPGSQSMEESQIVLDVFLVTIPSLHSLQMDNYTMLQVLRKIAHMVEYGVLVNAWLWNLRQHIRSKGKIYGYSLIISFLTACLDETIQIFSHRTALFQDVIIDTMGVTAGIIVCICIRGIFLRKKKEC